MSAKSDGVVGDTGQLFPRISYADGEGRRMGKPTKSTDLTLAIDGSKPPVRVEGI